MSSDLTTNYYAVLTRLTPQQISYNANSTLKFENYNVKYSHYSHLYHSGGWLKRKLIALPSVLWTSVIQLIYHLSKAIFVGTLKIFFGNKNYIRAQFFFAARDIHESYGRIISLFHDRYGLFIIHKCELEKYCYESFMKCSQPAQNEQIKQEAFLLEIQRKTEKHVQYLSSIGLSERAKGIKVSRFQMQNREVEELNLAVFNKRTAIPQEVLSFDPNAKNTLITTDPDAESNKLEDLQRILDIRLYPALRDLIKQNKLEVFLGTKQEMFSYYKSKEYDLLLEFIIPSSAIYYLAQSKQGNLCVIMGGLVSRENIIAQLLTLKLANLKVENVEIIGEISHFTTLVEKDMERLLSQKPELKIGNRALIVAGCGLENTVNEIIKNEYPNSLKETWSFKGDIISLLYTSFLNPQGKIHGFISLHLNYGEITEEVVKLFLEYCNCSHVFTGGAGGYISNDFSEEKPPIGSRIGITKSMNEKDEIVAIESSVKTLVTQTISKTHLQIPSIFLETYKWLEKAKTRGSSVDVETFYIIRAIQKYNFNHPLNKVTADCGYFVSDYVGEQPLREYSKVYQQYPRVLSEFLKQTIANEKGSLYLK